MSGVRQKYSRRYKESFDKGLTIACGLCSKQIIDREDITVDHIHPQSKGGKNSRNNFQPAHLICNNKKGNHEPY